MLYFHVNNRPVGVTAGDATDVAIILVFIGAGLAILGLAGYTPNVEQTQSVQLALRILYALVPAVLNLVGLVIALAYPISDDIHAKIKLAIGRKQDGKAFENPLAAQGQGV